MNDRDLIYRHGAGAPWNKTNGSLVHLPEEKDERALAVKFVYWPDGQSDGTAQDPGGLVFEVSEWCKALSPEGEEKWSVRFRKATKVSGIVSSLFKGGDIVLARGIREMLSRSISFEVEDFVAETDGQPYLTMKGAKEAMVRFYGVDAESITITLSSS